MKEPIKVYIFIDFEEQNEPSIFATYQQVLKHISPNYPVYEDEGCDVVCRFKDDEGEDDEEIVGHLYISYLHFPNEEIPKDACECQSPNDICKLCYRKDEEQEERIEEYRVKLYGNTTTTPAD